MELSKEMLQELKCIECDKYLTCGPIYIRNTSGEAICGRCSTAYEDKNESEDEDEHEQEQFAITRNKQYETLARKILFPCVNIENGCRDKVHFSENKYSNHEHSCKYRDRICPVSKSGECDWFGPWTTLVAHCQQAHPNNVFSSPCTLQHDITKDSLNAYLVSAFNDLLFILHVKVCVKSAKIYHSLRYLGNPKKATTFKYKLDVQHDELMLTKPGKVAPEGILTIQINSALALCVNSLLGFLGDYDYEGTTFTVTVQKNDAPKVVTPKITCLKCAKETKTSNKVCGECQAQAQIQPQSSQSQPPSQPQSQPQSKPQSQPSQSQPPSQPKPQSQPQMKCARQYIGCNYKEKNEKKCVIHERYFCLYRSSCFFCSKQIQIGKIQQHYLDDHANVTHQIGSSIRINQGTKSMLHEYCFLSSSTVAAGMGKIICWYTLNDAHLQIDIITSLASDQLDKYRCLVHITNPKSKFDKMFILTRSTTSNSDWSISIPRSNVPSNNKKFDMVVFLTEA